MAVKVEYQDVKGLGELNAIAFLTMLFVFGFIAFIPAVFLWYSGVGGIFGVVLAFLFAGVVVLIQWYMGPTIIRSMANMREIKKNEFPEIQMTVKRLSRIAGIPVPKLYVVYNSEPNAFAFGRTTASSSIAVHTGLLNVLDEKEVEGVLAHEIGHIKHRDVLTMTVASMLPIFLYYLVLIGTPRGSRRGGGSFIAIWIGAMLAQFLGQLIVLFLSRKREYYADAFSAYVTKNPVALMSGLAKITYGMKNYHAEGRDKTRDDALRCFYIADPKGIESQRIAKIARAIDAKNAEEIEKAIQGEKKMLGGEFLRTHPFTGNRLSALWKIEKELHTEYRSVGAEY